MTPFLDEGAMPRAIATDGAPSRSRARPTQYVRPLAKAGGRKRLLTLVLAGCVLVVGGGAAAVLLVMGGVVSYCGCTRRQGQRGLCRW
jgi:hypothetical protein